MAYYNLIILTCLGSIRLRFAAILHIILAALTVLDDCGGDAIRVDDEANKFRFMLNRSNVVFFRPCSWIFKEADGFIAVSDLCSY